MEVGRRWTDTDLIDAVATSRSLRHVIHRLGLVPAGGNYVHVSKRIQMLELSTEHFTGQGWLRGIKRPFKNEKPLKQILIRHSSFQSHKLKLRLFKEGKKKQLCEECGWAKSADNGRIPLELDHINGDRTDNRITNLRILCPNCHSLKPTHRGRNKKRSGGGTGIHARLKIS